MPMLDMFNSDAFGVISMTDAINKAPFVPGRAGQVIDWNEQGIRATTLALEEIGGELRIVNPTPRGGVGETDNKEKRTLRSLAVPHYQIDGALMADEIQGVRAFGSETELQTIQGQLQQIMDQHAMLRMDPTLEYQRIGALKGIILNGNGSTLYNLFTEFGVTPPDVVDFDFADNATDKGKIRALCDAIVRNIARRLGGVPFASVYAFTGDAFWDALVKQEEVRETFLAQAEASQLRDGTVYQQFRYGGITFENYRGGLGGVDGEAFTAFFDTNEARFFPVGVPGLFRTVYAPADYIETVNTLGLPRYSKQYRMPNDKGITVEMQMNALSYCTRPTALVQGVAGSA